MKLILDTHIWVRWVSADDPIDSRYPGEFELLPDGKPTIEDAGEFYQFAQNIHTSVSDMLAQTSSENE